MTAQRTLMGLERTCIQMTQSVDFGPIAAMGVTTLPLNCAKWYNFLKRGGIP
jgi:hypothetical protein